MTPERYERLCQLFDQVHTRPADQRAAFLNEVGASDPALRAELESMLANDEQARVEGLFQAPAPANARALLPDEPATLRTVPSLDTEIDDLIGRRIGPYLIEQRVGRGGMGNVYRALREDAYRQKVAIKVIRPGLASDEALRRFRTERQVLAELEHPHIARLLDGGATDDGRPYFVMEYIDGEPLSDYCERRQLDTRARLLLLLAVCAAVEHAHEHGVLHRDLKSDNVLVTADGTPKVTDFGLARRLEGAPGQTQSGVVLGTPGYMAPEQAAGNRAEVGLATDVYALGAILYELLTGRPPFRGNTALETLRQMLTEEPVPPGHLHPGLPRDLDTICLKCLHKEPRKRYASAEGLADDLRRFLDGRPIQARPTPTWERVWKWAKRRPLVAGLTTVSALAAVALAIVILIYTALLREKTEVATSEAQKARDAEKGERAARLREQDKAVRLAVGNGSRLLLDGDLTGALPWYVDALREDHRDPLDEASAAREEMHRIRLGAVLRQCPRLAHIWFHDHPVKAVCFSPDGSLVLIATSSAVHVYLAATGQPAYPPLTESHGFTHAAFSPTGKLIVTAAAEVCLWDAATGKPGRTIRIDAGAVRQVVLSPEEERLLIVSGEGVGPEEARIWDIVSGKPRSPPMKHGDVLVAAAFKGDGMRVLTAAGSEARVWDAVSGMLAFPPLDHGSRITHASFSPESRQIATAGIGRPVRLWDAATGRPTFTPPAGRGLMNHASFSPDGRMLLAVGKGEATGGEVRSWETATGRPWSSWALTSEGKYSSFSPDGARVLVVQEDGAVRVWLAATGEALTPPLRTGGRAQAVFSPDGRFLITAGADGIARLWDLALNAPSAVSLSSGSDGKPFERLRTWASGDGRCLLGASELADGSAELRVWDTADGKPVSPPLQHPTELDGAAFGPGRIATLDRKGRVRLWDQASGRLVCLLTDQAGAKALGFASGGRLLTLAADGTAKAWDADSGEALSGRFDCGPSLVRAAFSDDGRRLATIHRLPGLGGAEVRLWDTTGGASVGQAVSLHEAEASAALTSDGSRLLTATTGKKECEARVWDAATGRPVSPPLRVPGPSILAALSPDGRFVATHGLESGVRVWDASTGEPITSTLADTRGAVQLFFDSDGLLTLSERREGNYSLNRWTLAPTNLPLEDLERLVGLISGERIDTGGPAALSAAVLHESWEALLVRQPDLRRAPPDDVLAWHRRAAEWCQLNGRWSLSLDHLNVLIAADPHDGAALGQRARAYEELARWDEALTDAGRAVEVRPTDATARKDRGRIRARTARYKEAADDFRVASEIDRTHTFPLTELALMHLASGDVAGYRATCKVLFDRFAKSPLPTDRVAVVWTCCLGAGALEDPEGPVRLAERLVPAGQHFPLLLRAAAECRAGRPGAAAGHLDEAIKAHGRGGTVHDWLFLALANQRLGRADAAKRLLDQADRTGEKRERLAEGEWEWELTTRLLRQEIESALTGAKP
jgi:WD40 repeat protein/tetratricopeptide (TPR) repeat protein